MIATAPAAATHAGRDPQRRARREAGEGEGDDRQGEARQRRALVGAARAGRGRPRSTAKKRVSTTHSTATAPAVGSTISPAKRVNDSPLAWKASRLVRLETGSSSDAELARCEQA